MPVIDGNTGRTPPPQQNERKLPPLPPGLTIDNLLNNKQKNTAILERQVEDMLKTLNQLFINYEQIIQMKDREIEGLKKPIESVVDKPVDPQASVDTK